MRTSTIRGLVVLACMLGVAPAQADSQLWVQAGLSGRPKKRLELVLSPQVRLGDDMSRFYAFLPEGGVRYRAKKWIRLAAAYRYEYERVGMSELFVTTHRAAVDVRVRHSSSDVRLDYRVMVVEKYRPAAESFKTELRNRLDVAYRRWRPWVPYVGSELFVALGDVDKLEYDKLRFTAGLVHERGDHELETFLRAELHADAQEPTSYILGVGYNYDLL